MTAPLVPPGIRSLRSPALAALLTLLSLLPLAVHAVDAPPAARGKLEAAVDRAAAAEMAKHRTPGMVIAVVDHGKVALLKGYGTRRVLGPPADENTVFCIGSLSKVITAYGALLLVDQGKLDLDKPVKSYITGLPPAWRGITTRQLLTHTSGIPRMQPAASFDLALLQAFHEPVRYPAGTGQDYDDFNYAVVGKMIEAISGQHILDFLQARLLKPLGMTSTGIEVSRSDRAVGYTPIPQGLRPAPRDPMASTYLFAAEGLESSMSDLLKLDAAIRTHRLLKPATAEAMWRPVTPPGESRPWAYTPGWQRFLLGGAPAFAKGGKVIGFRSFYEIVPGRELSLLALYNLSADDNGFWPSAAKILREVYGIAPAKGVAGGEG